MNELGAVTIDKKNQRGQREGSLCEEYRPEK
jgi:hypothetical protein